MCLSANLQLRDAHYLLHLRSEIENIKHFSKIISR